MELSSCCISQISGALAETIFLNDWGGGQGGSLSWHIHLFYKNKRENKLNNLAVNPTSKVFELIPADIRKEKAADPAQPGSFSPAIIGQNELENLGCRIYIQGFKLILTDNR